MDRREAKRRLDKLVRENEARAKRLDRIERDVKKVESQIATVKSARARVKA